MLSFFFRILHTPLVWTILVCISLPPLPGVRLRADAMTPDAQEAERMADAEASSPLSGEAGFYHEEKDFSRDRFVEDEEQRDLPDERFTAAFLKLDYETPEYLNFTLHVGATGYLFINEAIREDPENANRKDLLFRELYLQYDWSKISLKLGRQEIGGTTFEDFYFEAFSLTSLELENVAFVFVAAKKAAEVDLPDIVDFRDVNFDNHDAGATFYVVELTWKALPDLLGVTPYYMRQTGLFDLYGAHLEFTQEWDEFVLGLAVDYYRTDEDRKNGITNAQGRVTDTNVFHIEPTVSTHGVSLGIGYIEADREVGAREGDLIDDYFNPLNEGDMLYQAGAKTWYGEILWEWGRFNVELSYGDTEYREDLRRLTDREFNVRTELALTEDLLLQADFAHVDSESPEGSFHKFETDITYAF
jgi:hypothetical protein